MGTKLLLREEQKKGKNSKSTEDARVLMPNPKRHPGLTGVCLFCFESCIYIPLHIGPEGHGSDLSLPLKADNLASRACVAGKTKKRRRLIGRRRAERVCNLLFISRYMRLEGPWQRPAAALADSS